MKSRNPFFIRSVFVHEELRNCCSHCGVAIPFSSGLCSFRTSSLRGGPPARSQSLFHQVCVRSIASPRPSPPRGCRNPFFIRSVFVPVRVREYNEAKGVAIPFSSGLCSFRPLDGDILRFPPVAIPFSSGLCSFTFRPSTLPCWRKSQSLFHQVCVRSKTVVRIDADPSESQSLFHQVCVRSLLSFRQLNSCRCVAIPFSSGLCSFQISYIYIYLPPVAIPFSSGLCSFSTPTKHTAKTTRYDDTCADS